MSAAHLPEYELMRGRLPSDFKHDLDGVIRLLLNLLVLRRRVVVQTRARIRVGRT